MDHGVLSPVIECRGGSSRHSAVVTEQAQVLLSLLMACGDKLSSVGRLTEADQGGQGDNSFLLSGTTPDLALEPPL